MNSTEFKTELKNKKEFLKGKKINLVFVSGNNDFSSKNYSFDTLKDFGNAVLSFEKIGAGFGFLKVSNLCIEKNIKDFNQFNHYANNGVWNTLTFLATTVKL
jgi:hypothetical protein